MSLNTCWNAAKDAADRLRQRFSDGVWFVELGSLDDVVEIVGA
jgi:hypothetical protein